jgi:cytochrome c oxidase cbb3-type subunit 2
MFSTRRIGPDLTRVGRKYGDDWHIAHLWNPQDVVADSIMPRFTWLFEEKQGNATPQPTEDGKALVAYLQRLGTSIGDWRSGSLSSTTPGAAVLHGTPEGRGDMLTLGRSIYERRCMGCHGAKGDGKGPSAQFLNPKPRDFTTGLFKFRSTAGKDSLPTDADLYLTLTHGLWGTSMPSMHELPAPQRWAVIQFLKTFSDRWAKEPAGRPIAVPPEPPVTQASIEKGNTLFQSNCALCHGEQGRADGALSQPGMLVDDWGEPLRPAHLSLPAGAPGGVKLGHGGLHLYQIIVAGISGTPMPPFEGLKEEEVWDLVHFVQSLRVTAHEAELVSAGLQEQDRNSARDRIWAAISGRAAAERAVTAEAARVMASGPAQH